MKQWPPVQWGEKKLSIIGTNFAQETFNTFKFKFFLSARTDLGNVNKCLCHASLMFTNPSMAQTSHDSPAEPDFACCATSSTHTLSDVAPRGRLCVTVAYKSAAMYKYVPVLIHGNFPIQRGFYPPCSLFSRAAASNWISSHSINYILPLVSALRAFAAALPWRYQREEDFMSC